MSKFYSLTSIFNKLPGILNPLYEAEKYTEEPKDIARIESMLSKSTDPEKLRQLAAKMVKSIKQKDKMVRRYKAALKVAGPDSPITQEFV